MDILPRVEVGSRVPVFHWFLSLRCLWVPLADCYFGSYFWLGGERFDMSQPEAYLFGENSDVNFLTGRAGPVMAKSLTVSKDRNSMPW